MSGLFLVLDCVHWKETKFRTPLCHDAGRLLIWILERQSIPRDRWRHGYCFKGAKKSLPTKKRERQKALEASLGELHDEISAAKRDFGELALVGVGRLACESLTGASVLKDYSGTTWPLSPSWRDLGLDKVWISQSTDAALYNPTLSVEISGTLLAAAKKVGIPIGPFRGPGELPEPIDWLEYQGGEDGRGRGTG